MVSRSLLNKSASEQIMDVSRETSDVTTKPKCYELANILVLHPVRNPRFVSNWTQPLDVLSADSEFVCYYLSTKRCLGNPTLGTNRGQRILAMRTGCKSLYVYGFDSVGVLLSRGERPQHAGHSPGSSIRRILVCRMLP